MHPIIKKLKNKNIKEHLLCKNILKIHYYLNKENLILGDMAYLLHSEAILSVL